MRIAIKIFLLTFIILFITNTCNSALIEDSGITMPFPSSSLKNLKLGLMDIALSYRIYSFGVELEAKWPYYIIGLYNANIKLSQEIEIFKDRSTMLSGTLEGNINQSDKILESYSISNINVPIYTTFLSIAQEIIPYNIITVGLTFKSLGNNTTNEEFFGAFLYSEVISLPDTISLPIYLEFITKVGTPNTNKTIFYEGIIPPYMLSLGTTVSLWNNLFNVKIGIIYPGISIKIKDTEINSPVIPYLNIYFLL